MIFCQKRHGWRVSTGEVSSSLPDDDLYSALSEVQKNVSPSTLVLSYINLFNSVMSGEHDDAAALSDIVLQRQFLHAEEKRSAVSSVRHKRSRENIMKSDFLAKEEVASAKESLSKEKMEFYDSIKDLIVEYAKEKETLDVSLSDFIDRQSDLLWEKEQFGVVLSAAAVAEIGEEAINEAVDGGADNGAKSRCEKKFKKSYKEQHEKGKESRIDAFCDAEKALNVFVANELLKEEDNRLFSHTSISKRSMKG